MIMFDILTVLAETFILLYVFVNFASSVRNKKYQKLWNREKETRLRLHPTTSNAQLCEYYVMFCKRHDCKVEY